MKPRSTTSTLAKMPFVTRLLIVFGVLIVGFAVPIQMTTNIVGADEVQRLQQRIDALRQDAKEYESRAAQLGEEAKTLQTEVSRLSNEKAIIQNQLDLSQAKHDQLVVQIQETEQRIEDNRDALGETIADLYVDDSISPIEMLASSGTISDFLDRQEYRISIRDQLTSTISTIKDLKKELEAQKQDVERVLADQKVQRDALASKEGEQQSLLSRTRGDENAYKQLVQERTAEVDSLQQKLIEEVARRSVQTGGYAVVAGPSHYGGYPTAWATAPMNSIVDPWGMYSRQCTSYAAFRVSQAYGNMPYWGGFGNAWEWTRNANNYGIPNGSTPKPGSVAVLYDGGYGHVAWVDSVQPNGTLTIDHYNINWSGNYARWTGVSPNFFDNYIYFGEW